MNDKCKGVNKMGKTVGNALEFERTPLVKKPVKRPISTRQGRERVRIANDKALNKHKTGRIVWHLLRRHQVGLLQLAVAIEFAVLVYSKI